MDPVNAPAKFEDRSFTRSRDNSDWIANPQSINQLIFIVACMQYDRLSQQQLSFCYIAY